MSFECSRCGRCCEQEVDETFWVGGRLSWEQKQELIAERKKYPAGKGGCSMLYFKKDVAYCLVREMFGEEIRDNLCKIYPKAGTRCLNGVLRTNE